MGGKSRDGGKGLADSVRHVAYAKFAHSGRVDEKYAVHIDELPMRGGVPSLAVEDAYLPVRMTSCPTSAFTRVDLPTPDEPNKQIVVPGVRYARSASMPQPSLARTACTGIAPQTARTFSRHSAVSGQRSALVSTTIGFAPPWRTAEAYRAIRLTL